MLPTEVFAEALAFLRPFDLRALAVTNALCSSLAIKASTRVRWEEFPGIRLFIEARRLEIWRGYMHSIATLAFKSENRMIAFVAAAFPNCIFDDIIIVGFPSERLLDAIGQVADSVIIRETFSHYSSVNTGDSLGLLQQFRKVKVSFFLACRRLSCD